MSLAPLVCLIPLFKAVDASGQMQREPYTAYIREENALGTVVAADIHRIRKSFMVVVQFNLSDEKFPGC